MEEIIKIRDEYKRIFYKTGNLYYFLIAQEFTKVLETKFENESTASRLSRIESSVFGTNFSNDSESERIARISSAINAQKSARRYDSNKFGQNMATAMQIGTIILMVLACIL